MQPSEERGQKTGHFETLLRKIRLPADIWVEASDEELSCALLSNGFYENGGVRQTSREKATQTVLAQANPLQGLAG